MNEIIEVRVIRKKWIAKTGNMQRKPEKQLVPQRNLLTRAVERLFLAKRLRVIVAASVALGASLLIHRNLAVIVAPVSTALYVREIISIFRKSHIASKNPTKKSED